MRARILARRAKLILVALSGCGPAPHERTVHVGSAQPVPTLVVKEQTPPDTDGDGFTDDKDKCPLEKGTAEGCPARPCLSIIPNYEVKILERIRFSSGQSRVFPPMWYRILDEVASTLKSNPDLRIRAVGHTDSTEPASLGQQRADEVKKELVKRGVDSTRIETISRGSQSPAAPNTTAEGRDENRRVEFDVIR